MRVRTRLVYLVAFALIFGVEVLIAKFAPADSFVRGSVGDILVIVLLYCLLRAILGLSVARTVAIAVGWGFIAESLQYVHLATRLGFHPGQIMYVVIGNTFSPQDLLMYALGGLLAGGAEFLIGKKCRDCSLSSP